jgi:hypothetical protein
MSMNEAVREIDWDIVIKAIGALVGAIVAYIQIRSSRPISRSALRSDLEILRLVDPADPTYTVIKGSIDRRIKLLYAEPRMDVRWAAVIFGSSISIGFSYATFYLVRDHFNWWSLLTAYFAMVGLSLISLGFTKRSESVREEMMKRLARGEQVDTINSAALNSVAAQPADNQL